VEILDRIENRIIALDAKIDTKIGILDKKGEKHLERLTKVETTVSGQSKIMLLFITSLVGGMMALASRTFM